METTQESDISEYLHVIRRHAELSSHFLNYIMLFSFVASKSLSMVETVATEGSILSTMKTVATEGRSDEFSKY